MPPNPYQLSNIMNRLQQQQRMLANIQTGDKLATIKFMGHETELHDMLMRDKEIKIADLFEGGKSKEGKLIGGLSQGLNLGASFMNPLAGGLTSGFTSLLTSGYMRKEEEKRIQRARLISKMPEKYLKSFLGKTTKDFTGGYEKQFKKMERSLASDSDIFKSALMSGLGTYLLAGGSKEMDTLREAAKTAGKTGAGVGGIFQGGFDFTGAGEGALFGEGNLLQKLFKGGKASKEAAKRLAPLLQFLNY